MACQVFFNSNTTVNLIKIDNKEYVLNNNIDIDTDTIDSKKNTITSNTVLFNDFSDTINAKYVNLTLDINQYKIYRKTPKQEYYDYLTTLVNGELSFTDHNIQNKEFYNYLIVASVSNGGNVETTIENRDEFNMPKYIQANWSKWSIVDISKSNEDNIYKAIGDVWTFTNNLESGDTTQNTSVTKWDTLGKYSQVSVGEKNYDSGNVKSLLGEFKEFNYKAILLDKNDNVLTDAFNNILLMELEGVINTYTVSTSTTNDNLQLVYKDGSLSIVSNIVYNQSISSSNKQGLHYTESISIDDGYFNEMEKTNAWKSFCSNGKLKLLKDRKGNKWIVQIAENSTRKVHDQSTEQLTTISFNWEETMDHTNISIIETVGD